MKKRQKTYVWILAIILVMNCLSLAYVSVGASAKKTDEKHAAEISSEEKTTDDTGKAATAAAKTSTTAAKTATASGKEAATETKAATTAAKSTNSTEKHKVQSTAGSAGQSSGTTAKSAEKDSETGESEVKSAEKDSETGESEVKSAEKGSEAAKTTEKGNASGDAARSKAKSSDENVSSEMTGREENSSKSADTTEAADQKEADQEEKPSEATDITAESEKDATDVTDAVTDTVTDSTEGLLRMGVRLPQDMSSYVTDVSVAESSVSSGESANVTVTFGDGGSVTPVFAEGDWIAVSWTVSAEWVHATGFTQTIPLTFRGVHIADAAVSTSGAVITFRSEVNDLSGVSGSLRFQALCRNENSDHKTSGSVTFASGKKSGTVEVTPVQTSSKRDFSSKTGEQSTDDPSVIVYTIVLNQGGDAKQLAAGSEVTITDTLRSGQAYAEDPVTLQRTKGSAGSADEFAINRTSDTVMTVVAPASAFDQTEWTMTLRVRITDEEKEQFSNSLKAEYTVEGDDEPSKESKTAKVQKAQSSGDITGEKDAATTEEQPTTEATTATTTEEQPTTEATTATTAEKRTTEATETTTAEKKNSTSSGKSSSRSSSSTTATQKTSTSKKSVKTGDSRAVIYWVILLAAAVIGVGIVWKKR